MGKFVNLNDGDGSENLCKSLGRDVLDCLYGGHGGEVSELDVLCNGEVLVGGDVREGHSELLESESKGGDHGGTAVLELSGAEEGSGGL